MIFPCKLTVRRLFYSDTQKWSDMTRCAMADVGFSKATLGISIFPDRRFIARVGISMVEHFKIYRTILLLTTNAENAKNSYENKPERLMRLFFKPLASESLSIEEGVLKWHSQHAHCLQPCTFRNL